MVAAAASLASTPFACLAAATDAAPLTHDARCGPDGNTGLGIAVVDYDRRFSNLMITRGAPPPPASRGRDVSEQIRRLNQSIPGTALLLYGQIHGSDCVFLIGAEGDPAGIPLEIPIARVGALGNELRRALRVDQLQLTRAPQRRGAAVAVAVAPAPGAVAPGRVNQAIEKLSSALLPVALRAQLARVSHLVIVPVAEIGTIPFALLRPFGDSRDLIDAMSLSVAPNLGFAATTRGGRPGEPGSYAWTGIVPGEKALVVGNPAFARDDDWDFPPLPGAEKEARFLAGFFGTRPLLGGEATVQAVKSGMRDADYIFIASHAIADEKDALKGSFVALAGGRLSALEVQREKLKPGLVVLSACQTGLGQQHEGGIIGLARAFHIAGAGAVVMSLWSIDDEATYHLVTRFAEHLKTAAPHEAMRRAMMDARKKFPNPAQWAPLVYFGLPMPFKKA